MFTAWLSGAAPSPLEANEPLTPLPPKLHLRSPTSSSNLSTADPIPVTNSRPSSPPHFFPSRPINEVAGSEIGGHSYAELLTRDVRQNVIVHNGSECAPLADGRRTAKRETMLALPGGEWAVVGPDAHLLLGELHRARISVAQKNRRRTGHFAGALSLVVLLTTLWYLVEVCGALIQEGGKGKGVLRWVELSFWLTANFLWIVIFVFLRTRRVSVLAVLGVVSGALISFLHISLALTNFILAFVWNTTGHESLSSRCDWGIDVAWTMGDQGDNCSASTSVGGKAWPGAAAVRVVVTVVFLGVWLKLLWRYNAALHTPFRINPSALPSSELRSLLERHRADIVPLPSTSHAHPAHLPSPAEEDHLPAMPERGAHYRLVSEREERRMWSYRGSEEMLGGGGGGGGIKGWMGAKLWGGMGWLFGSQPYELSPRRDFDEKDPGEKPFDVRDLRDDDFSEVDLNYPQAPVAAHRVWYTPSILSSNDHEPNGEAFRHLFDGMGRPPSISSASLASAHRLSTGTTSSSAPLLRDSLPTTAEEDEEDDYARPPPPPPLSTTSSASPRYTPTGSSGSSNDAIVYVRMSDGRLVRRLSTIASMSEAGLSTPGGIGGRLELHPSPSNTDGSRDGSESFATAREVLEMHRRRGDEEQVLILAASGEEVESWRQRTEERR